MIETTATELNRLMHCIGSRLLPKDENIRQINKDEIDEGNAVHWLIKEIYDGRIDESARAGFQAPNKVFITNEMLQNVKEYFNSIFVGWIEHETSWFGQNFRINGRADHLSYVERSRQLNVDDYKNGWSIVDPAFNWTLISHAIGWMIANPKLVVNQVQFGIYQPKPYHRDGIYRRWSIPAAQLYELQTEIMNRLTYPSDVVTSGDHCRRCLSILNCPSNRAALYHAVDTSRETFDDNLSNDALSAELKIAKAAMARLKPRIEAMEELTKHRVTSGQVVKDFFIETKLGHRRFKSHITPDLLTLALGGRDFNEKKLPTPKELERQGIDKKIIEGLTERPTIGNGLVQMDADKRAKKTFG